DGFVLKVLISDGRYTRLFGAMDEVEGGEVALKFPKPQVATAATYHAAFVREAWVGARVNSPWIGRIIELPPGRQTCLYTATPLAELRPDLPAWLQVALGRAIATDPAERFREVMEFALEMEAGPSRAPTAPRRPQTLYERSPLRFWQGVAALLALALILSLW